MSLLTIVALVAVGVSSAFAEPPGTAQANANQVRDQLRSNSLREQQRQQTSQNTRQAFASKQAQSGIDHAAKAQSDRYQAQQRNRVEDYLTREQAKATAASTSSQPASASSTH